MFAGAFALVLTAALAGGAAPARAGAARPLAIRAEHLDLGDGRSVENGIVLIEGGLIRGVGAGVEVPSRADWIEHKGHACPGLVGLHGSPGVRGALRDATRAVLASAQAAYAFDPDHFELEEALHAGITSVVLTPSARSLAAGISAVVKSAGGRILEREAQLSLGFSADALGNNRFPTSYAGAIAELEQRFARAADPSDSRDSQGPFAQAAAGKLPVLFETRTRADVRRAIDFAMRHKLAGAISGAEWAGELAAEIKPSRLTVVCGPFGLGADRRAVRATIALAEAGIPIAFAFDSPAEHPAGLRLSAALCLREGLDPVAAWKGLCTNAASTARVGDRIGRLEHGFDADIVLWSGDPLDLSSRVQAVYIDGVRVWKEQP